MLLLLPRFFAQSIKRMFFPPLSLLSLVKQMEFVGNRSLGVVLLAGSILGAVFGLQMGEFLVIFNGENMIGATSAFAMTRQFAPVFGSFIVTARAGSAMASEIATMRVNEQIDALEVMAINPIGYLISPRILASVIMMPLLTCLFLFSSVFMCLIVGVFIFEVDVGMFFDNIPRLVSIGDLRSGLEKSAVFGGIFSTVGCFFGFHAQGGTKGVGKSTSNAVMYSLVIILAVDFFLSYIQYMVSPPSL